MVTDEMVEKAADAMARQDITFANCDRTWQRRTIRAALEAALSAAEPAAAWQWRSRIKGGLWDAWENGRYGQEVPPFMEVEERQIAAPKQPAPSVAVKAQQAVWIKHDGKNMPVNAETIVEVRMASGFEHEADFAGNWLEREGSKSNWHHDLGCPHPCDIVAYHIVTNSPALSAEVQDVAGMSDDAIAVVWKAAMTVAANIIIKRQNDLNDDDGPMHVLEEQGECISAIKKWMEVDEPYLQELRHMLPAAPAKQEG